MLMYGGAKPQELLLCLIVREVRLLDGAQLLETI